MRSASNMTNDSNHHNRGWVTETVRRIQHGIAVESHFELLFREVEPSVRRRLQYQGWHDADLDDLVQEVMLRVYRGLKTFRLDASFDTWILQIMSNASKNAIRHRNTGKARATRTSLDSLLASDGNKPAAIAEPKTATAGPLDATLAAELKASLAAALDVLPARMRQCLLFRYQGYKYKEIAEAQGVSIATVKKQVSQGHRRLRPILGEFVEHFGVWLLLSLLRSPGPFA